MVWGVHYRTMKRTSFPTWAKGAASAELLTPVGTRRNQVWSWIQKWLNQRTHSDAPSMCICNHITALHCICFSSSSCHLYKVLLQGQVLTQRCSVSQKVFSVWDPPQTYQGDPAKLSRGDNLQDVCSSSYNNSSVVLSHSSSHPTTMTADQTDLWIASLIYTITFLLNISKAKIKSCNLTGWAGDHTRKWQNKTSILWH